MQYTVTDLGPWSSKFKCNIDPMLRVAMVANRHGQSTIYLRVTIICRYIFLQIWFKAGFARTNIRD